MFITVVYDDFHGLRQWEVDASVRIIGVTWDDRVVTIKHESGIAETFDPHAEQFVQLVLFHPDPL